VIIIVDTGGANIASVRNAFDRLGVPSRLSGDAAEISGADRVILPGVGAAADSMRRLKEANLIGTLKNLKCPTLGICLGMQLLFCESEEGTTPCLDILPGTVARLKGGKGLSIPHMGWNRVSPRRGSPLFKDVAEGEYFYFVHSYAVPVGPLTSAVTGHGAEFAAAAEKDNFHGVQFHPERSGAAGAQVLRNFLAL
jgi:glutamine amidotransferase